MPASAATSSIEVAANPPRAKAAAAACRIWAWRSSRCISRRVVLWVTSSSSPLSGVYASVYTWAQRPSGRAYKGDRPVTTDTTEQVEFTEVELLADHDYVEPLIANGIRCHGGFTEDGAYVSPRTRNRWPAINAWEAQRAEQFGTPILDIPLETWPENFPNVAQSKLLLRNGVRRAHHLGPHPHRHGRGLRRDAAPAAHPRLPAQLRRGHHGHGHRPHRPRPVRGPRPRRGRLRRRGRPQPDVVRGP